MTNSNEDSLKQPPKPATSGILFKPKTEATLRRMRQLNSEMTEVDDESVFDEYRELQRAMVSEFLPLIKLMAEAGLFTLYLENQFREPSFEVASVFDNGNIWLRAGSCSGYTPVGPEPEHLSNN